METVVIIFTGIIILFLIMKAATNVVSIFRKRDEN